MKTSGTGIVALIEKHLKQGFWGAFISNLENALKSGANPNSKLSNGKPILNALLEVGEMEAVNLLMRYKADANQTGPDGHNALSTALKAYQLPFAKPYLMQFFPTVKIPAGKLEDPAVQAAYAVLVKKSFNHGTFVDIDAQNNKSKTLLHISVQNNDTALAQKLLKAGINPLLKDSDGKTALKVARDTNKPEVIKTIVNHYLENHHDILKYSDFKLFKAKDNGISVGGFYFDKQKQGWLLKEGHDDSPVYVAKEYIAGALYQFLLGENAPLTKIVIDDFNGILLTGSKLLANFNTLSSFPADYDYWNVSYGEDFPHTFNGKPLTGFMDGIMAINFMSDTDAHSGNVGMIDHSDHYSFAKIDHGFSFSFSSRHYDLDSLRMYLDGHYSLSNLESLGFEAVYQSITNISDLDFSNVEEIVQVKIEDIKNHMQVLELSNLNENYDGNHASDVQAELGNYQKDLIDNLKKKQQDFHKMADFMTLEKAIIDHDWAKLTELGDKGVKIAAPFKPFFSPLYEQYVGSQSVTGYSLIKQHWPEILPDDVRRADQTFQPLPVARLPGLGLL